MWFQTVKVKNKAENCKHFIVPTRVLQIWQCSKCHTAICQHKYLFSPFHKGEQLQTYNLSLESINLKLMKCSEQKFMKIGFKNKQFTQTNQINIFCKLCKEGQLLGTLEPELDFNSVKLTYKFVHVSQNVKITKITYVKSNKIQSSKQKSNPFLPKEQKSEDYSLKLNVLQQQIQRFAYLWFWSKNFKIYRPFSNESDKKRQQLQSLRKFIVKMTLSGNKNKKINVKDNQKIFRIRNREQKHNNSQLNQSEKGLI